MTAANDRQMPARSRSVTEVGQAALDRIFSFRVTYLGMFIFLVLYVSTVRGTEAMLRSHFREAVAEAVEIDSFEEPVGLQIQSRINARVAQSAWVRIGGVRVTMHVFGQNGRLLYLNGHATMLPSPGLATASILREAQQLLPATGEIDDVVVPIDSLLSSGILVLYAAILLQGLFIHYRSVSARERAVLETAATDRDVAAERARSIEAELEQVRQRLDRVEPAEREHAEEIRTLQQEREALQSKLAGLALRERELRGSAERAIDLDQERRALEELLDEAAGDLTSKTETIRQLEKNLKRAAGGTRKGSGRAKESETLARRFRTLYKALEIDDRAVDDLVGLRDEAMKLKAEESLKRLSDETENVAVRRKLGGLPPYLSIFELGFAGKGRIYYTKGRQRRFRVLSIGSKNSQKADLEYLSRLDRSQMS